VAHTVRFTENFTANLDAIREYLASQDPAAAFEQLLDRLFDVFIANLELFPRMGRTFLGREPTADEGRAILAQLKKGMDADTEVREYIDENYLILYAIRKSTVFLLSIRHHLQLSFDLKGHWL